MIFLKVIVTLVGLVGYIFGCASLIFWAIQKGGPFRPFLAILGIGVTLDIGIWLLHRVDT